MEVDVFRLAYSLYEHGPTLEYVDGRIWIHREHRGGGDRRSTTLIIYPGRTEHDAGTASQHQTFGAGVTHIGTDVPRVW